MLDVPMDWSILLWAVVRLAVFSREGDFRRALKIGFRGCKYCAVFVPVCVSDPEDSSDDLEMVQLSRMTVSTSSENLCSGPDRRRVGKRCWCICLGKGLYCRSQHTHLRHSGTVRIQGTPTGGSTGICPARPRFLLSTASSPCEH